MFVWFNLTRSTKFLLAICCITLLFQYLFKNLQKHKGFCGLNSSYLGNTFIFCIKGVGTQSAQFGCAPECSFQETLPNDPELFGMNGFLDLVGNQWVLRSLIKSKRVCVKCFFSKSSTSKDCICPSVSFQSATTSR